VPEAARDLDSLILDWHDDPVLCVYDTFETDLFGNPVHIDPAQIEILEGVRDHDRVAVPNRRGQPAGSSDAADGLWAKPEAPDDQSHPRGSPCAPASLLLRYGGV
jgi:hypothetical protein